MIDRIARGAVALSLSSVFLFAGMAGIAFATDDNDSGNSNAHNKITICHRTGSNTNPYVVITPNANGVVDGHAGHTGPIFPATGPDGKWGDIIPSFSYNDHGTTKTYPGQNNTEIGNVILANGCNVSPTGGMGGGDEDKVTLCHATSSNTNPYVQITVDNSGAYNGHYSEHKGSVYPGTDGKWGDIIPPFTFENATYQLNWDASGQAIYRNGCKPASGGMGGGTTTTFTPTVPTTPTTPVVGGRGASQVEAPVGGVSAGQGGASTAINTSSLLGLLGSIGIAGIGMRRLGKQLG